MKSLMNLLYANPGQEQPDEIDSILGVQDRLKQAELAKAAYAKDNEEADKDLRLKQTLGSFMDDRAAGARFNPFAGVFSGARDAPGSGFSEASAAKRKEVAKPGEDKQAILDEYRRAKLGQFNKEQDQALEMDKFKRQQDWDMKKIGIQNRIDTDKAQKASDKDLSRRVVPGVGVALTDTDAKELKDASQMKQKLDSQIGELISLRKNKGAEMFDREAVARGKQLSKDLLLTYKNLAKLGVLSAADTAIIDAIIPQDPTEFRTGDFLTGSDSVLSNFESFREDLNRDYENNLKARLESREQPQVANNEDQQAMQWAQANPNDPRAKAIMEKLGGTALAR
jgi:hypothetical protein